MTLAPGATLGPYKILAPLGAGGMGEVYRARDTRLGRDVAVKVLPHHLSENAELRARFEREAKTISSLNHPHICTLFDVGREGETDYLVMELVEGETLAARIGRGALPPVEVLRLGVQIADALDRAHRAGVVHRDLKPGNVMLTKGRAGSIDAKLMDFGLARATGLAGSAGGSGRSAALTQTPAVGHPLTAEGTIVGTFQYMAPELLEGNDADARADLWALGCVLYEMATGKHAFEGTSQASLIASILKEQPRPLAEQAPLTPPALERVVKQCLAKDPEERWQTASDLRRELQWIAEGNASAGASAPSGVKRSNRERLAWGLAAVSALLAIVLALALRSGRTTIQPVFTAVTFRPMAIFKAAFAPDGKTIIFSAAPEGNIPHLFVIRPENPDPQAFGDPGTHLLSVSSKGEMAVLTGARYVAHRLFTGTLARMPLGGGAPREILENVREADWSPDGSQLAIIRHVSGKDRLEFPIGTILHESGGYLSDLRFSPRGDRIAFFEHPWRFDDRGSVNMVDLQGKATMLSDGYSGEQGIAWSPDGTKVLFSATLAGSQWMIYSVTPAATRQVALQSAGGLTIHDVNAKGRWLTTRDERSFQALVHIPTSQRDRDISWLNGSLGPHLSQDGREAVFTEMGGAAGNNYALCFKKTEGGGIVRLGEGLGWDLSPDGKKVLAMVSSPPHVLIYPTGAGEPQRLDRGDLENYGLFGGWFPGGDSVFFVGNEPGRAARIYVQDLAGGRPRGVTPEGTLDGVLSRDGTFILARGSDRKYQKYPLAGGEPHLVPWLTAEERVVRTSLDGLSVLAAHDRAVPCRVERIDLESGHRTRFREIAPEDRVGLLGIYPTFISDDERSYAYATWWHHSTLFTVEWRK